MLLCTLCVHSLHLRSIHQSLILRKNPANPPNNYSSWKKNNQNTVGAKKKFKYCTVTVPNSTEPLPNSNSTSKYHTIRTYLIAGTVYHTLTVPWQYQTVPNVDYCRLFKLLIGPYCSKSTKYNTCSCRIVSVSDYDSWCLLNCRDTCTLYLWRSMCGLCIHVYDSMSSQTLRHEVLDIYIPPTYLSYIAPMLTCIYMTEELMPYSESSYICGWSRALKDLTFRVPDLQYRVETSWYFLWESTGLLAVTESCLWLCLWLTP